MNRWKIPAWLEQEALARDQSCIYCGASFSVPPGPRRARRSWEHIVNDAGLISRENIALCCIGCNASKGAKDLAVWLETRYCKTRGISEHSLSVVARAALSRARAADHDV